MFLRDVEQNPQPSPHTDLIRMMQANAMSDEAHREFGLRTAAHGCIRR
jgi:hypothetical protein